MGFAARAVVEAYAGPAAIAGADGRILVANQRWGGPAEGEPAEAHGELGALLRGLTPASQPVEVACECDGEPHTVRVVHLESDCGSHRRLITVHAAGQGEGADAAAHAKSRFLALLGHEIRTPVTAVVAMVDLLRAQQLSPEAREVVDNTHRSVHALRTLTDDMLDLARLETGTLEVQHEPVRVRAVLESVIEPLQHVARRKGILLLAAPSPALAPVLEGDPDRLAQVLTAVVGNAVKFTADGEVVLTAEPGGADTYLITVSDTGPGIDEPQRRKIFLPFVQADSSAARKHEGAGLGLALAARLVERMGGELAVDSTPGEGSHFRIRLPLRPVGGPDRIPAPLARRRVAVVAPTPRSMTALSWLLASAGAEPVPTTLERVTAEPAGTDTVLWCDDAHDPEAVQRADRVIAALGPEGRALMVSATDPRSGIVRKPRMLTAPLVLARLVAALNQERTGVRGAPVTVAPLGSGRVLLAEDNDVNRTVFQRMIRLLGVECDAVADGSEALAALLGGTPYDVVLMDLQMPGTDGIEATRRARAAGLRTPILALTATALQGDKERCFEAGMDGHLSKPITLPELRAALVPYLDRPESPPPADDGAEPVDLDRIKELEEQLEDRGLVVATVATYLAQLPGRRAALAEALRETNLDALRAAAHTLKSSSALLGAAPLAEACAELERQAANATDAEKLAALVDRIEGCMSGVTRVLESYVAEDEGADRA